MLFTEPEGELFSIANLRWTDFDLLSEVSGTYVARIHPGESVQERRHSFFVALTRARLWVHQAHPVKERPSDAAKHHRVKRLVIR